MDQGKKCFDWENVYANSTMQSEVASNLFAILLDNK